MRERVMAMKPVGNTPDYAPGDRVILGMLIQRGMGPMAARGKLFA